MITILVHLVLWILYSGFEGIREGYYFNCFPKPAKPDIHILFTLQRLTVILVMCATSPLIFLAMALMFPFFHDGFYYATRHKLNVVVYPKGFWSDPSSTSTALLNFKLKDRILMLVGSVVIIITYFILHNINIL